MPFDDGDDQDPTKPAWMQDARISGNVAKMRQQGASDPEIQDYLTRVEKVGAPATTPAPVTAPAAATPKPLKRSGSGFLDAVRNIFGQGLMMGGGDEAEAGLRAYAMNMGGQPGSFHDKYSAALNMVRDENAAYERDHPVASTVGKIGGAVLPILASAGAGLFARGATAVPGLVAAASESAAPVATAAASSGAKALAKRLGGAALAGGTFGTAAGALEAEPDSSLSPGESVLERLKRGASVAPLAAGFGLAALPLAAGGRRAASGLADLFGVGGAQGAERRATTRAADLILQRQIRSGTSIDDMEAEARRLAGGSSVPTAAPTVPRVETQGVTPPPMPPDGVTAPRKPVTLMDVAGQPGQRLAAAAVSVPSGASQRIPAFLEDRMFGSGPRLARDLEQGTGMPTVSQPSYLDILKRNAQPSINAAYDRAWQSAPPIETANIADALQSPTFQKAESAARTRATEEVAGNRPGGPQARPMGSFTDEAHLDTPDGPQVIRTAAPEVHAQDIDRVKQQLDVEIGRRQQMGDGPGVRSLTMMKNKIIGEVDAQIAAQGSPDYAKARGLAENVSRKIDAFKQGEQVLTGANGDSDAMKDYLMNLTGEERDEWRKGAQLANNRRLRSVKNGRSAADALVSNPEAQSRLQLVIDDNARWKRFSDAIDAERQFGQTRNAVTQGSRTTPLALDVSEMAGGPNPGTIGNDLRHAGQGPMSFMWGQLLKGGVNQYNQRILGIRGNVADQLGNIFMSGSAPGAKGAQDLQAAFDLLRRRQAVHGSLLARYLTPGSAGGMMTNSLVQP